MGQGSYTRGPAALMTGNSSQLSLLTSPRLWALIALALSVLCLWFARVTPEQVQACAEHTGWTEARCQVELGR